MVMDRRLCRICQSSEADIDLHRSGKICTSLLLNTLSSQELTFLHLQITLLHPSLTASMHGASTWCQPAKVSSNHHLSLRTMASVTSRNPRLLLFRILTRFFKGKNYFWVNWKWDRFKKKKIQLLIMWALTIDLGLPWPHVDLYFRRNRKLNHNLKNYATDFSKFCQL